MKEEFEVKDNVPDEITGSRQLLIRRVEEAIYRHPGVDEVAAVFLPGINGISELAAFIVPLDLSVNAQIIKHFLEDSRYLSGHELPRRYHLVPEIPKSPSGKAHKNKLIKLLVGSD